MVLGLALKAYVPAGIVAVAIDPAWALPLNTFFLVLIALLTRKTNQRVENVSEATKEVAQSVNHVHATALSATTAAAAAASAAADSARITKELGGALRSGELKQPRSDAGAGD